MLICVPDVLTKAQVASMRQTLLEANWVDGNETSGTQAALAKKNRQLPLRSDVAQALGDEILDALGAAPLFVSAALPYRTVPPLFNRYDVGDGFDIHVDNAIRPIKGTSIKARTDLSVTLFLTEPEAYDGGELVIETEYGAQAVKLEAGSLVLYPSTSLHKVMPVTRGSRISSFFWVQSMIRDEGQRTLLFDLDQSIQSLTASLGQGHPEVVRLTGIYHNLIRRWAEC